MDIKNAVKIKSDFWQNRYFVQKLKRKEFYEEYTRVHNTHFRACRLS
jgi:hypothetical protein